MNVELISQSGLETNWMPHFGSFTCKTIAVSWNVWLSFVVSFETGMLFRKMGSGE